MKRADLSPLDLALIDWFSVGYLNKVLDPGPVEWYWPEWKGRDD